MKRIVTELEDQAIKEILLLPQDIKMPVKIKEEAVILKTSLIDFGINNSTKKLINKKEAAITDKEKAIGTKVLTKQGLDLIRNTLFMYKIIAYKDVQKIAQDHNLLISSLSYYDKHIEQENLDELQGFKSLLVEKRNLLDSDKITFPAAYHFMFSPCNNRIYGLNFAAYFNIMAPKSHFKFPANTILFGNEIKAHPKRPGFKWDFKINKPEPKDPIILAPFQFMGRVYCAVVTAWDEVADDLRIRTIIE